MKLHKILSFLAIGTGALLAMSSCADDRDSNPTVIQPVEGSFVLFQPEVGQSVVNLKSENSDYGIVLTWNQPKYTDNGAPLGFMAGNLGTSYRVMVSLNGKFTSAFDVNNIDGKSGTYIGPEFDYVKLDAIYQTTSSNVLAADINKALNRLNQLNQSTTQKWEEGMDIDPVDVTIMVESDLSTDNAATVDSMICSIKSNTIKMRMKPYWVEAAHKDDMVYYFITGNPNNWSTDYVIPMFPTVDDPKIQNLTTYEWCAYDLKIWTMENVGDWNNAVGCQVDGCPDESGALVAGGNAINSPSEAYYTFTINLNTNTYQWTKYSNQNPTEYSQISLIGANGDWGTDIDLNQVKASGKSNKPTHIWYKKKVIISSDCEVKFRVDHLWVTSWGNSSNFPYGKASEGSNITGVTAGTYNVYFNDITKEYSFVPVE